MKSILIIDDEKPIQKLLLKSLMFEGHQVFVADNGRSGLKIIKKTPPDLVVTDLIMPGKEGLETIREIKAAYPEIKIIAISGGGSIVPNGYLDMALKFGADYTFAKPVDNEKLISAVNDLLSSQE